MNRFFVKKFCLVIACCSCFTLCGCGRDKQEVSTQEAEKETITAEDSQKCGSEKIYVSRKDNQLPEIIEYFISDSEENAETTKEENSIESVFAPEASTEENVVGSEATSVPSEKPADEIETEPTSEPVSEPEEVSVAVPEENPLADVKPGTYTAEDGSVLKILRDGTVSYKTEVSGTVNGTPMTGKLTFSGTYDEEGFTFTKVTYLGMDITGLAAEAGFTDGAYWETEALDLYMAEVG